MTLKSAHTFRFSPQDTVVVEFLHDIKLNEEFIQAGEVTTLNIMNSSEIDIYAFEALVSLSGDHLVLEASDLDQIAHIKPDYLPALFRLSSGPDHSSASGLIYRTANNEYGNNAVENFFYIFTQNGVPLEDITPKELLDAGFRVEDLRNLYFDGAVTNLEINQSVFLVTNGVEHGSAVHLGGGYFLTAHHVLFDVETEGAPWNDGLSLKVDGSDYPITPFNVVADSPEKDVSLVYLPSVPANLPSTQIGGEPSPTDTLIASGYVMQNCLKEACSSDPPVQVNVYGKISSNLMQFDNLEEVIPPNTTVVDATIFPGMSGGGFFNLAGGLVGINSWVSTMGNISGISSITAGNTQSVADGSVLEKIGQISAEFKPYETRRSELAEIIQSKFKFTGSVTVAQLLQFEERQLQKKSGVDKGLVREAILSLCSSRGVSILN